MPIDRVENWKRFSEHMEQYIREKTVEKYGMGDAENQQKTFDLMSISDQRVCVWNLLKYSLRLWNLKGKGHDLEKIAHYAELAWTMSDNGKTF